MSCAASSELRPFGGSAPVLRSRSTGPPGLHPPSLRCQNAGMASITNQGAAIASGTTAFDAADLMAAEMGLTPDVTDLHLESERRRAEAEALAELVRQGATNPDTDHVVGLVTETACRLLRADYAGVALVEPDGSRSWRGVWGNRTDAWRTT